MYVNNYPQRVKPSVEELDSELLDLQRQVQECILAHRQLAQQFWLSDAVMSQTSHSIKLLDRSIKSLQRGRDANRRGE